MATRRPKCSRAEYRRILLAVEAAERGVPVEKLLEREAQKAREIEARNIELHKRFNETWGEIGAEIRRAVPSFAAFEASLKRSGRWAAVEEFEKREREAEGRANS